ncbi:TonB-dependent receptor [Asticcacaulis machinosus]|uniref:TonB-dependent receptor n=1 Tax=Asticcacaulis machinosus TaxID=2984211 RepID=A0ABT5HLT2_9CAUL|nr:TonB-dependent receptor [Asticcacaulis machinosus]MDC7677206.1 TonB-dependent receptor [Asticcacaulis machinosus]
MVWTLLAAGAAQARERFYLPAQALDKTLTEIARTGGVNIAYSPELVSGLRAPVIREASSDAAIKKALDGSGLRISRTPAGTYLIEREMAPPPVSPPLMPYEGDAQGVGEETIPEVIVRGYRSSLSQSARVKAGASGMLDSIVAEDIMKFPDNNLAEAVQRISGVAITRDQGEGRSVSVRGLGPEFTRVLINDMEAQASTDGLIGGVNRGRGFDFNVFPTELFSRIDVRKTTTADESAASIGATINLVTPKPFNFADRVVSLNAQAGYNDLSDRSGGRISALYSRKLMGGKLGVLVAVAHTFSPREIQGVNSGGWSTAVADGGFCAPTVGTGGLCDVPAADFTKAEAAYGALNRPDVFHPRFYRYTHLIGKVERTGAIASLQWRPRPSSYLSVNLMAARYATQRSDYFLEAIGFSRGATQGGKPEIVARDVFVDPQGALRAGTFDNVDVRSEMVVDNFTTDFKRYSVLYKENVSDKFRFDLAFAASRSRFDNREDLAVHIDRFNVDGYSFDTREHGLLRPDINYGFDVADAGNWYFGPVVTQAGGTGAAGPEIRLRPNGVRHDYDVWKLRTYYDLSYHMQIGAGLEVNRYKYRSEGSRLTEGESGYPAPDTDLSALTKIFCGLSYINPPGMSPRCWRVPDVAAFVDYYDLYSGTGRNALSPSAPSARALNQAVDEDEVAGYLKLKFRTKLFQRTVFGNAGIRAVSTRQDSDFYLTRSAGGAANTYMSSAARRYNDVLPSVNLMMKWNEQTYLKTSWAEVVAKPPLAAIATATTVEVSGGRRQITTGNPNLDPIRATSFDASYEYYPGGGGLMSVALFHKRFHNYIQNRTYIARFSDTDLPLSLIEGTGVSAQDEFSVAQYVNTPGGRLSGVELYYQNRLSGLSPALHDFWRDFGVNLNYTYVNSSLEYLTTNYVSPALISADLTNVSRSSYNATLYYERARFEGRISVNYRDEYLTSVPGSYGADAGGIEAATYIDAAFTYRLTPRLALTLEGLNLSNEPNVTWDKTDAHLVGDARYSGRQLYVGFRYSR